MMIFDFRGAGAADVVSNWYPIDDVVMGGVSSSRLEPGDGAAVFHGRVSLENNGGFASVRSQAAPRDLGGYNGIALRVLGDGHRYKLNLRNDGALDGILYRAAFTPPAGIWREVRLPFREFVPTFRGRLVPDAPPLDLSRITTFGLMISDKQSGTFRLEVDRIEAYR